MKKNKTKAKKTYKATNIDNFEMFPSDSLESLDVFSFGLVKLNEDVFGS